jgi:hypothetical protein
MYLWLYDHFPGFNAFREASKFYFLVALGYSVLIGSFVYWLWHHFNKSKWQNITKHFLTFLIAILFLWNVKPIITGEIGTLFISRHVPNDYLVLRDFILKQDEFFRTFWTPTDSRWGIYTNQNPKISNIFVVGNNWKNLTENYNKNTKLVQDQIINVFKLSFIDNLMDISSIKYIIIPLQDKKNDDDFFIYYGGDKDPNIRQWYINQFGKVKWLKKIDIGTQDLIVYENANYKDHIYLTKKQESIYVNIEAENVDYEFVNPTEYKISLKNIKENTYLNFSEKYHPDWSLRIGKFNWFSVLINKNYFLGDKYHLENDAGLTSFLIDSNYIKQNFPKEDYTENPDGSIDVELTLYFKPQSYFYLGLIISGTTLLGCLGYLGYDFVNRRRKNKKLEISNTNEDEKHN